MEKNNEKFDKVLDLLRQSKPVLGSTEEIERRVIQRISKKSYPGTSISDLVDFMFAWVYISWVRRSLITASVMLVAFFVWQQGIIIKQINYLSSRPIINNSEARSYQTDFTGNKMLLFKLYSRKLPSQNITISKEQMDALLDSVNDLQTKYKDLINLIEEDPEFKKNIENKLIEMNRTKFKL